MKEQAPWVKKNLDKQRLEKKANKKLFSKLKNSRFGKKIDQQFNEAHDEVFAKRDCLDCANCCRTTSPIFRDVDIERLAKHFRMKAVAFIDEYLFQDADGDYVLRSTPCPFLLEDHKCSVYEWRPKACRDYPHTDRKNINQVLELTHENVKVCPAVVDMVERIRFKWVH